MNIAFYIDEMNYRGIANQTFKLALSNKKILRNKSFIFYNKINFRNKNDVIKKFKNNFSTIGVSNFKEIENFKDIYKIDFIYTQKSGNIDNWYSKKIKTLIHAAYPQKLTEIHGHNYAYVSEWLSNNFSNKKIPFIPYIVEMEKTKDNLKKHLNIKTKQIVFGCHGGESSFDLKFVQDVLKKIVQIRKDIIFVFLNIEKFCHHPRIKFLKGTTNDVYKKKFVNTCDAMIYARSLGESFGLSCGEFSILDKPIFSYKFNRHKCHKFNSSQDKFFEYSSFKNLYFLLKNFKKNKTIKKKNKYKQYSSNKVMREFKNIFLKGENRVNLSFIDYVLNYLSFYKMHYFYLRHKLYNHYYNYFESKFINFKD